MWNVEYLDLLNKEVIRIPGERKDHPYRKVTNITRSSGTNLHPGLCSTHKSGSNPTHLILCREMFSPNLTPPHKTFPQKHWVQLRKKISELSLLSALQRLRVPRHTQLQPQPAQSRSPLKDCVTPKLAGYIRLHVCSTH